MFHSVPLVRTKPVFAPVLDADVRELHVLDEFIKLKKPQIAHFTQMERNRIAIIETKWLKNYLAKFLQKNHVAIINNHFWPNEYITNTLNKQQPEELDTTLNFLEEKET